MTKIALVDDVARLIIFETRLSRGIHMSVTSFVLQVPIGHPHVVPTAYVEMVEQLSAM